MSVTRQGEVILAHKRIEGVYGENDNSGAVYTYLLNDETNKWRGVNKLQSSDLSIGDKFGKVCSMSDDGNKLVVCAPGKDNFSGKVYTFLWNNNTGDWNEVNMLQSSDMNNEGNFGLNCSLSDDGNKLVVGARTTIHQMSVVYTYLWNDDKWDEVNKFQTSDINENAKFGMSCALSGRGDKLVVGDNSGISNTGIIHTYLWNINNKRWNKLRVLSRNNTNTIEHFGVSCTLSHDGNKLEVGAYINGTIVGTVYNYFWITEVIIELWISSDLVEEC